MQSPPKLEQAADEMVENFIWVVILLIVIVVLLVVVVFTMKKWWDDDFRVLGKERLQDAYDSCTSEDDKPSKEIRTMLMTRMIRQVPP